MEELAVVDGGEGEVGFFVAARVIFQHDGVLLAAVGFGADMRDVHWCEKILKTQVLNGSRRGGAIRMGFGSQWLLHGLLTLQTHGGRIWRL